MWRSLVRTIGDGPVTGKDSVTGSRGEVTTKDHYHHGSLRQAALDAARGIVCTRGHDAVAMRDLAQHLGVTPAALYRHFSNRSDLLMALAEKGHQGLLGGFPPQVEGERTEKSW